MLSAKQGTHWSHFNVEC